MGKTNTISGLDIGSGSVRAIIAEEIDVKDSESSEFQVLGVGEAFSSGLRKGVVVDIDETVSAIHKAIEKAERASGSSLGRVFLSIEGSHISTHISKGTVVISKADGEVSEDDMNRAIESSQALSLPPNREVLKVIPQSFSIDGEDSIKYPVGMSGVRLEVETLIVEASTPAIKNIYKCLEKAEVEVEGLVLAPMAAAYSSLDKKQKELGVALVDIGAGTTGLCVYEEGSIIHVAIIPVGGNHITNDIAIGLRSSIELAEKVKLKYGSALLDGSLKQSVIDFSKIDSTEEGSVSRYKVSEIIEARLSEIFSLVNKELKSIDREKLLPAGVVLTGGASKTSNISGLAKKVLELPARVGHPGKLQGMTKDLEGEEYSTLIGLVIAGSMERDGGGGGMRDTSLKLKEFFRKFLP
jgi:cell division protein FtsA